MQILEFNSEIRKLLQRYKLDEEIDKLNACSLVYGLLEKCENEWKALKTFFEEVESADFSGEEEVPAQYSETESKAFRKQYGEIVEASFESLLAQNLSEEEFYEKLWVFMKNTPSIEQLDAKVFALYDLWTDPRIPYFHVGTGLSMSNQRFRDISKGLEQNIEKARFVLYTNYYTQRTSRASELLKLLKECSTEEEQAVLMAHILSLSATSSSRTIREILEKIVSERREER